MGLVPWAAFGALGAVCVGSAVFAYCVWHGIGPSRWYSRGVQPLNESMYRAVFPTLVPNAVGFNCLLVVGILGVIQHRHHLPEGVHVLLAVVGVAAFALLILSGVTSFMIFTTGRPQRLVPPPFRD